MTNLPEDLVTLARAYVRGAPGDLLKGPLAKAFLNARLRDQPRQRVVDAVFDAKFAVDTRDLIQRYVYMFGVWEPHMTHWLQGRLRSGDVFLDVGSNIGYLTVLGSRLVGPAGRVVSVEAAPAFHRRLLQHVALNGCDNVRAINAAVSDSQKKLTFVLASSENMGANSIVPYEGEAEATFEMEASPLPDLLENDEIARARVIKIDVEGAEGSVIRGLAPVLHRMRRDVEIAVEVTPQRMELLGDSLDELLTIMQTNGFHRYRLPNAYAPEGYPRAIRRPSPPVRCWERITGETELVFSRFDGEALT